VPWYRAQPPHIASCDGRVPRIGDGHRGDPGIAPLRSTTGQLGRTAHDDSNDAEPDALRGALELAPTRRAEITEPVTA
jgi:hypothetical protein